MTVINAPATSISRKSSDRRTHRLICVAAGGLALLGGTLALVVHPWFASLAAVGGIWLIFAPESNGLN